jgi:hypothetical protein
MVLMPSNRSENAVMGLITSGKKQMAGSSHEMRQQRTRHRAIFHTPHGSSSSLSHM